MLAISNGSVGAIQGAPNAPMARIIQTTAEIRAVGVRTKEYIKSESSQRLNISWLLFGHRLSEGRLIDKECRPTG